MRFWKYTVPPAATLAPALCVLILALSGCVNLAARTSVLPPAPATPGAMVSSEYICIPVQEAGELLLWIEHAEEVCR